jgi:hypothetical protein
VTSPPKVCSRCQGPLEAGYVLDRSQHNQATQQRWIEGPPERSFWTGMKTRGREAYSVTTYRCERCGFLESYASTPVSK